MFVYVTVVDTLASSYTPTMSVTLCGAAEAAATRKRDKYAEIIQSHVFSPIAIETICCYLTVAFFGTKSYLLFYILYYCS